MPTLARPRRHASAAARRAQILDAALDCFAARGYHDATMDDLVRASGLSKGSLYWHFSSKEEVFLALFDRIAAEIVDAWDSLEDAEVPTFEAVRRITVQSFVRIGEGPALRAWASFLAQPESRGRLAGLYHALRERLVASLTQDRQRGLIRDIPVESAAATLVGALEGIMLQAFADDDFDPAAHWPTACELVERGLAP